MTMPWEDPSADVPAIVEAHGTPNVGRSGVLTREDRSCWAWFTNWLFPVLDDQRDDRWRGDDSDPVVDAFRDATPTNRSCPAAQTVANAGDLAAEMDVKRAMEDVDIMDQSEFQDFLDAWAQERVNQDADAAFRSFMEMHPAVLDRVERLKAILEKLRLTRGTVVRVTRSGKSGAVQREDEVSE